MPAQVNNARILQKPPGVSQDPNVHPKLPLIMIFTRLSALLALAGVASAHFQLTYPPTRGFVEDQEINPPCGGFNTVQTNRTPFSLGNTFIKLASEHESATVLVMISFDDDPTDIKNFTLTPSPLRNFFQINGEDICIQVDIGAIGYPNATEGAKATIAVQYSGGDGNLFQCSDVILKASAAPPSNVTCTNEYNITSSSNGTGTGTGSSPSATATTTHSGVGELTVGLGFGGIVLASLGAAVFAM